jgi:META domain
VGGADRRLALSRSSGSSAKSAVTVAWPGPFTRMAGPEPAMRQGQDFLAALSGRRPSTIDGEALVIGQGAEQVRLLRVGEGPSAAT